jgi:hypothetical protein
MKGVKVDEAMCKTLKPSESNDVFKDEFSLRLAISFFPQRKDPIFV